MLSCNRCCGLWPLLTAPSYIAPNVRITTGYLTPGIIGSFSKLGRWCWREHHQTKGLMNRTIHVVLHMRLNSLVHVTHHHMMMVHCLVIFFKTTMWNDEVLCILENTNRNGNFFVSSFGIECCHCIFSLVKFLERQAFWSDLYVSCKIRRVTWSVSLNSEWNILYLIPSI